MHKIKISVAVQTDIAEMLFTSSSSSNSSRSTSEPDLLAAWSDLLAWSENSAEARKLQEEMLMLKNTLNRLGQQSSFELLDTEPALQIAIESLKNEKTQLQTYRTKMLRLNASVHRWLTRSERKTQKQPQEPVPEKQMLLNKDRANLVILPSITTDQNEMNLTALATNSNATSSTTTATTTTVTVTDNNGNKVETQSFVTPLETDATINAVIKTTSNASESTHDLAEHEFHDHLKDAVSDMYSAWDEADGRINHQIEMLTTSLVTWRQLESGLSEFQHALGQDRGTLKGLEGALNKGQTTPNELAQNVKLVAKLLSEKVNVSQAQLSAAKDHLDPLHLLNITQFTTSSGSLSDSGISDGGAISDGGLSERERRLGVLRRLAKQLECALAPGSEAMKSIAARMESAEAELKQLQNTCRDLIVRTASTHENNKKQLLKQTDNNMDNKIQDEEEATIVENNEKAGFFKANGHAVASGKLGNQYKTVAQANEQMCGSPSKRKNKHKNKIKKINDDALAVINDALDGDRNGSNASAVSATNNANQKRKTVHFAAASSSDATGNPYDDPPLEFDLNDNNNGEDDDNDGRRAAKKHGWMSRITRAAVPLQMALVTFLFAAAMMQPNCCDNLNNMAYSFTPQLRYIRGPPPT